MNSPCTVHIAWEFGRLDEIATLDTNDHLFSGNVMIITAVYFPRSWFPGRMWNREAENISEFSHQLFDEGGFSRARWTTEDHWPGAKRRDSRSHEQASNKCWELGKRDESVRHSVEEWRRRLLLHAPSYTHGCPKSFCIGRWKRKSCQATEKEEFSIGGNWKTNPLATSELHATWLGWVTKDVSTNEEAAYILWHGGLLIPTSKKHVLSRFKEKEAKEPIEPTIT